MTNEDSSIESSGTSMYFLPRESMISDARLPCDVEIRPISSYSPNQKPFKHTSETLAALRQMVYKNAPNAQKTNS